MHPVRFSVGWDEAPAKRIAAAYEAQDQDKAVLEDETAFAAAETVMNVPRELVAQVRELIARNQK